MNGLVQTTEHDASLVVANDRRWSLDPKLGSLHVYIDGRPRRVVGLNQKRVVLLSPGVHTVRVRQWWFMSPPRTIDVTPGSEVRLRADVVAEGTTLQRLARAVFRPLHSLALTQDAK